MIFNLIKWFLIWICLLTLFSILCRQSHQYYIITCHSFKNKKSFTFHFVSSSLLFFFIVSPLLDWVTCSAFCRVFSSFAKCFLSSFHFLDPIMKETNLHDIFHQFLDAFHAVLWIRSAHCSSYYTVKLKWGFRFWFELFWILICMKNSFDYSFWQVLIQSSFPNHVIYTGSMNTKLCLYEWRT
jgi:hypothetical protein